MADGSQGILFADAVRRNQPFDLPEVAFHLSVLVHNSSLPVNVVKS